MKFLSYEVLNPHYITRYMYKSETKIMLFQMCAERNI